MLKFLPSRLKVFHEAPAIIYATQSGYMQLHIAKKTQEKPSEGKPHQPNGILVQHNTTPHVHVPSLPTLTRITTAP